jgi:hypothetical protein
MRPSAFVSGLNAFQRVTVDLAAAKVGIKAEQDAIRKAKWERGL